MFTKEISKEPPVEGIILVEELYEEVANLYVNGSKSPMLADGPHYNYDLEMAILGAILLENTAFDKVQNILNVEMFYYDHHKLIFKHLSSMWRDKHAIDMATATEFLFRNGIEKINGKNIGWHIVNLTRGVCSIKHLEQHAILLKEMCESREEVDKLTARAKM